LIPTSCLDTRSSDSDTNKLFQTLFQNSQVSEKREREWHDAVRHAGTGTPPLRFPVYEHLYSLNVYAQKPLPCYFILAARLAARY
jgi:hypothetical protein